METVHRLPDAAKVATRVADRLVTELRAAQAHGGVASVVLTGGTISRKVHTAVVGHPDRDSVDWGRVELWWGDERFVPGDDEERNAGQAWEDLLRHLPVDPALVHAMAASDEDYESVDAAAWDYAQLLRTVTGDRSPWFDLLLLGIGPDGHCASLFPGRAEVESEADVLAVREAPKPPPTRISMGMAALRRARHVVFVATGEEKASAVARSVHGADPLDTPAAGPRGLETTSWYVDEAAAALLP